MYLYIFISTCAYDLSSHMLLPWAHLSHIKFENCLDEGGRIRLGAPYTSTSRNTKGKKGGMFCMDSC